MPTPIIIPRNSHSLLEGLTVLVDVLTVLGPEICTMVSGRTFNPPKFFCFLSQLRYYQFSIYGCTEVKNGTYPNDYQRTVTACVTVSAMFAIDFLKQFNSLIGELCGDL